MSRSGTDIFGVYAIFGADEFRKREALEGLCARLAEGGEGFGPTRFSGAEAELADVLDAVRTFSLLGDRQVVIVEEADPFITRYRSNLETYCENPAESGVLILAGNTLAANTRLYKIISRVGEVIKCDPLRGRAIGDWIGEQARSQYGKSIDVRAAGLLRELVGDSLGMLDGELSKLSTFVADRNRITAEDVEALVGNHREETVFAVTDAMAAGNVALALHHWERVLATDRAAPGRAIGGLAWAIRRLLDIKLKAEQGTPLATLARQAFTDPTTLSRRLERVSVADLQRQLCDLLDADLSSKTGLGTVATAVERFIITHCTKAQGQRRTA